jgi:hypothetical protein
MPRWPYSSRCLEMPRDTKMRNNDLLYQAISFCPDLYWLCFFYNINNYLNRYLLMCIIISVLKMKRIKVLSHKFSNA